MIESSITEEIREENYSEKTSSDKTSSHNANSTPQNNNNNHHGKGRAAMMGSIGRAASPSSRDDHVIVREGVTSMFQHPASLVETEEGTDNSPRILNSSTSAALQYQ